MAGLGLIPGGIGRATENRCPLRGVSSRQRFDIAAYRRDEALNCRPSLDYGAVGSLSNEIRQKLSAHRPATRRAARISGVTPAALIALLKYVRRRAA
jgi:tRNA uridine 5-carboxymethylaminomethyl modification enzyme